MTHEVYKVRILLYKMPSKQSLGGAMLKKILATILIVSLTQVYANQVISERKALSSELAQSFDELNYKLNVEWNQKDAAFFDQSMEEFQSQIAGLQDKGLSSTDLTQYTMSKIKDEKSKQDVQKMVEIINTNNMSSEEARAFAVRHLNNTYAHGASWSGGRVALRVALMIAVIMVLIEVLKKRDVVTTPTPSETPTPTNSPEPTPTNSPEPIPTYTPEPTPTYSPEPTPTYSPPECIENQDFTFCG